MREGRARAKVSDWQRIKSEVRGGPVAHSLALRQAAGEQLARVHEIIEALAARDHSAARGLPGEVITAMQIGRAHV